MQSIVGLPEEPEVPGLTPGPAHTFVKNDHDIFSTVIFPFPLFQEEQLSVAGYSIGTWYWLTG